mmetsp:Transcript_13586/g.53856  ORF Transcript_13586/g.53856 Transcript_13586/m.53856 type:complete len:250 (-) Transcript_13586:507-1256(-)
MVPVIVLLLFALVSPPVAAEPLPTLLFFFTFSLPFSVSFSATTTDVRPFSWLASSTNLAASPSALEMSGTIFSRSSLSIVPIAPASTITLPPCSFAFIFPSSSWITSSMPLGTAPAFQSTSAPPSNAFTSPSLNFSSSSASPISDGSAVFFQRTVPFSSIFFTAVSLTGRTFFSLALWNCARVSIQLLRVLSISSSSFFRRRSAREPLPCTTTRSRPCFSSCSQKQQPSSSPSIVSTLILSMGMRRRHL